MAQRSLTIDVPGELIDLIGSPELAAARAREALVLELLREGEISQGKAAALLDVTRYEMLDLMARHQIPSGPQTPEEVRQEIEAAMKLSRQP